MPLINLNAARICVPGLDHPEGVALGPDGQLYAGGEAGQVYRLDWQGGTAVEYANTGGALNLGLAFDAAGSAYVCNPGDKAVKRVTPGGTVSVYSRGNTERAMITPNYPAFDADGNLYVADSGEWKADNGCVWVLRPGGAAEVIDTECAQFPNGCAVSPDGQWLYLAMSLNHPRVARFPIRAGRRAGPVEVVAELPHCVPDGLAFTADGGLLVACYRPDTIFYLRPDGALTVLLDDYEGTLLGAPTNVCFGGPDLGVLFWANLGRWHIGCHAETGLRGAALNYPKL